MEYGEQECLRDLVGIRDSTASVDAETALTFYLLPVLRDKGVRGLVALIQSLDQARLGTIEVAESGAEVTLRIIEPGSETLIIRAGEGAPCPWIEIRIESRLDAIAAEDPRHEAFYSIWDRFVRGEIQFAENEPGKENFVYLIATLESQIMNGGFGQYLTNTEGSHLAETFACLERIGAARMHALLAAAVDLAADFDSYLAAWDQRSDEYSRLDDAFFESAEDLAGLTADAFLMR